MINEKPNQDLKMKHSNKKSDFVVTCWIIIWSYFSFTIIGGTVYFVGIFYRNESENVYEYLTSVAETYILKEHCHWWMGPYIFFVGK